MIDGSSYKNLGLFRVAKSAAVHCLAFILLTYDLSLKRAYNEENTAYISRWKDGFHDEFLYECEAGL